MDLEKLLKQRSQHQARLVEIVEGAEKEDRKLNDAEDKEYSSVLAKIKDLDDRIKRARDLAAMESQHASDVQALSAPNDQPYAAAPADHVNRGQSKQEKKDLAKFSFLKALQGTLKDGRLAGIEAEMHQEGVREMERSGCRASDGVAVPSIILNRGSRRYAGYRNDMTTSSGAGGELIATETRAPIDVFYDAMVLDRLGATVLTGLTGNQSFPVMGAASQPTEKAENATADEVQATTSSVSMTPNRLPVFTELSNQLVRQDNASIENWLQSHLFRNMALRMQYGAINGSGSSNQPLGVLNTGGLSLVALGTNGDAPTRTTITRLKGTVSVANAHDGSLGFLTNSKVETTLNETKTDAGSGQFVWPMETPDRLGGAPVGVTNAVPSNLVKGSSGTVCSAIIYGNWSDLIIAQWGGIVLLNNPYTKMTQGLNQIGLETFYDVLTTRAASFAATKDALTVI